MPPDRFERKKAELKLLQGLSKEHPELFLEHSHIEDGATLSEFGIDIPHKNSFPQGLIKLWPEDFIVEERIDSAIRTIDLGGESDLESLEKTPTIYATLVKCNISTFEAATDISRSLGIQEKDVSFAGLKDKNAITAQKISIRKSNLQSVSTLRSPYYFLKEIVSGNGIAERGNLEGNRFTILVRTERSFFDPERFSHFANYLQDVKEHGFANFFYLQRFGVSRLRNFHWARLILQGKYEDAVCDFLTFAGSREIPYFQEMRRSLKAKIPDWNAVYKTLLDFPLIFEQELLVVDHLRQNPQDFPGALQAIPEQITFWLYALSSILFNKKLSEYLNRGEPMPDTLPFFLSKDRRDQDLYRPMLEKLGIFPPPFHNLRPFPQIVLRSRSTPTHSNVRFHKAELVDEGIVFEFDLDKGQYATTMLSHMFNLVGGVPPEYFSVERVDAKATLGETPITPLLERFKEVIHSKEDGFLGQLEEI